MEYGKLIVERPEPQIIEEYAEKIGVEPTMVKYRFDEAISSILIEAVSKHLGRIPDSRDKGRVKIGFVNRVGWFGSKIDLIIYKLSYDNKLLGLLNCMWSEKQARWEVELNKQ